MSGVSVGDAGVELPKSMLPCKKHTGALPLHALASSLCLCWKWAQKVRSHDRSQRGYVFCLLERLVSKEFSDGNDSVSRCRNTWSLSLKMEQNAKCCFLLFSFCGCWWERGLVSSAYTSAVPWQGEEQNLKPQSADDDTPLSSDMLLSDKAPFLCLLVLQTYHMLIDIELHLNCNSQIGVCCSASPR